MTNLKGATMMTNKVEHRYTSLTTPSRTSGYALVRYCNWNLKVPSMTETTATYRYVHVS
jgi:hypothetical protein